MLIFVFRVGFAELGFSCMPDCVEFIVVIERLLETVYPLIITVIPKFYVVFVDFVGEAIGSMLGSAFWVELVVFAD